MALVILEGSKEAEFKYLLKRLDVSASDLSKQMTMLNDQGYVHIRKVGAGRAGKTWYSLTPQGRTSFRQYKQALLELVSEPPPPSPEPNL